MLNRGLLFTLMYLDEGNNAVLNCSKHKRLQKVMILYRLIRWRNSILFVVENLVSFLDGSGKCRATLVK
jgi:hypothetical protein